MRWRWHTAIRPFPVFWERNRNRTTLRQRAQEPSLFLFFHARLGRRRDHIFLRRPVAKIDDPAAVATERHVGVVELDVLLTNRTLHAIWISGAVFAWVGAAGLAAGVSIKSPV